MIRRMFVAVAVAVALGVGASALWGPQVGTGLGVLAAVLAAAGLVLRVNREDRRALEEGRAPINGTGGER